jgi:hypothetical protein
MRLCKTIILLVVLYGCDTWSLTLREEHRLRVVENRVLMRIFGPKSDEVTGGWRKQYKIVLENWFCIFFFFVIPFDLQSVPVHSVNYVRNQVDGGFSVCATLLS